MTGTNEPDRPPAGTPRSAAGDGTGVPTPWSEVEAVLRQRPLVDVLMPGHIDRDGGFTRFVPLTMVVFLQFDEGCLRLESAGQYDHLEPRLVDRPSLDGVFPYTEFEEEGDEIAIASLGDQLWGEGRISRPCTGVRLLRARPRQDSARVTCLALELDGRRTLFLDPTWTMGIKVGGAGDLRRWESEHGTPAT
ncbi:hypothetical protein ACIQU5_00375 [Streptomyces sp. NPDC090306]|uniref:hypothetical protein n=1 Tax=unclassified Streptomyces TaxID=2593676 RepID=UPI0036ECEE22